MNGILVVSFGTTFDDTRTKNIVAIENLFQERYPNCKVYTAFTSNIVLKRLRERDIHIKNVNEALVTMKEDGITHVQIIPTHLLYGYEYEKIVTEVTLFEPSFQKMSLAPPLLSSTDVQKETLNIIANAYSLPSTTALLLVGHGTSHFANAIYSSMDYMAKEMGYPHIFVSTIEGYPILPQVLPLLKNTDYQSVHLVPFMLVAGDHAHNDINGSDEDSIRTQLEQEGYAVTCSMRGLGEYVEIRQLYCRTFEEIPCL